MDVARIAGFVVLGLALLTWGLLGAPLYLLALIAAFPLVTLLLPRGAGAAAATNLARRLYDRRAWQRDWDAGYLPDEDDREAIPPDLLPEDPHEARGWHRTLRGIRRLPEG